MSMPQRVKLTAALDVEIATWPDDVSVMTSAIICAVDTLSGGVKVGMKLLGPLRIDKGNRGNVLQLMLAVDSETDEGKRREVLNNVAHALSSPEFKSEVDEELLRLTGNPSSLIDIVPAIAKALTIEEAGFVTGDPPVAPIVPLNFVFKRTFFGLDQYDIFVLGDIPTNGGKAQIDWTQIGLEVVDRGTIRFKNFVEFSGPDGSFSKMVGDWELALSSVYEDDAAAQKTFLTTIKTAGTGFINIKEDGVEVASQENTIGTYGDGEGTFIKNDDSLVVEAGVGKELFLSQTLRDQFGTRGIILARHLKRPTDFVKIVSIDNSLVVINNDANDVIAAGTKMGTVGFRTDTFQL